MKRSTDKALSTTEEKKRLPFSRTRLSRAALGLDRRLAEQRITHDSTPYPISEDTLLASPVQGGVLLIWNLTSGGIARARTLLNPLVSAELQLKIYLDRGLGTADVVTLPLTRWTHSLQHAVPIGTRRVSATIGLLADEDFIHITASAPIRLMTDRPGNGPIQRSTIERRSKGLVVTQTVDWDDTPPPNGWQYDGLTRSTIAIAPRADELDKARVERRPGKDHT